MRVSFTRVAQAVLRWVLPSCVKAIYVDDSALAQLQRVAIEHRCPILFIPTLKGRLHSVVLTAVCTARDLAVPTLVGAANLGTFLWRRFGMAPAAWGRWGVGVGGGGDGAGGGGGGAAFEALIEREVTREYLLTLLEHGVNMELPLVENVTMGMLDRQRLSLLRWVSFGRDAGGLFAATRVSFARV